MFTKAIAKYQYPYPNFLILGHGRMEGEKSVVLVENNQYVGYGYFEPIMTGSDLNAIKSCIKPFRNNQDVKSILLSFIEKNKKKSNLFPF
jgi:DNA polymerase-3 subunit epsilon